MGVTGWAQATTGHTVIMSTPVFILTNRK